MNIFFGLAHLKFIIYNLHWIDCVFHQTQKYLFIHLFVNTVRCTLVHVQLNMVVLFIWRWTLADSVHAKWCGCVQVFTKFVDHCNNNKKTINELSYSSHTLSKYINDLVCRFAHRRQHQRQHHDETDRDRDRKKRF